jgi:mycothiol synthase
MTIFRRFSQTDLDTLAELMAVIETSDEVASRPAGELQAHLEADLPDLARTGWLAQIEAGPVIGYNYVEIVASPEAINFWLRGAVHPEWRGRGLGRELLGRSWADLAGLRLSFGQRPVVVNSWAYQHDQARCRLLSHFGLRPDHIYHELELPASQVQSLPLLPAEFVIRAWANEHCELAAELRNRTFVHSWGYQPTTPAALQRRFDTGRYEPALSFTAWRGAEMVGLVHACLGWTRRLRQTNEGEIVWVAVAAAQQGRGLGRALMLTAMNALRQAGAEIISVSADSYADRADIGLYTGLGFTVRQAVVDFCKTIQ